jgi:hypothetical protein
MNSEKKKLFKFTLNMAGILSKKEYIIHRWRNKNILNKRGELR